MNGCRTAVRCCFQLLVNRGYEITSLLDDFQVRVGDDAQRAKVIALHKEGCSLDRDRRGDRRSEEHGSARLTDSR